MDTIWLPSAVAAVVFILFLMLMPKRITNEELLRKRNLLDQMSQSAEYIRPEHDVNILKEQTNLSSWLVKIPGIQSVFQLLLKSGLGKKSGIFFLVCALIFGALVFALRRFGIPPMGAFPIAFLTTVLGSRWYLKRRIFKRNEAFLNLFPDAVDMIVRSVRSGHPLNTAMRMIAENIDNPVRDEFKQVVDEVSYGRSLPEALVRLSQRIDEPDLNFFVVVLSVHQETGGSLAEVLTNLSTIIRKRRQLRLKIRALTSEGRATSYVLGSLPLVELAALQLIAPKYLVPLFITTPGNIILAVAITLIFAALWIVRSMVNIDI